MYNVVPDTLDDYIFKIVDAYKASTKSLWECSRQVYNLYEMYGMYEHEFTAKLCDALSVQRDTIYHWRKAWDLRKQISETYPNFDFAPFSISHFYNGYDYLHMGLDWVKDFLETAGQEAWSVRKLSAEMQMATDDSGTLPWLLKKIDIVLSRLEKLFGASEYSGLMDEDREKLKKAIDALYGIRKRG